MHPLPDIILFVSSILAIFLIVEYVNHKKGAFLAFFSFKKLAIILGDITILSSLTYFFLFCLKGVDIPHEAGSFVLISFLYFISIGLYLYSLRRLLYALPFRQAREKNSSLEGEIRRLTGKNIHILRLSRNSPKITRIPLTSYITIGDNVERAMKEEDIKKILVQEIFFSKYFSKPEIAVFLIGIVGLISLISLFQFSVKGNGANSVYISSCTLSVMFLVYGARVFLKNKFTYLSDNRAAVLFGADRYIDALTGYFKFQEGLSNKSTAILISRQLLRRKFLIGSHAA